MKKVFEKIIEKQEELFQDLNVIEVLSHVDFNSTIQNSLENFLKAITNEAIEIVKQGGISDDVCECRRLKDCKSLFETSCGYIFAREGFKYCPYCGKKIKVVGDRYDD